MTRIDISKIDPNLLSDLDYQPHGWELFEAVYEQATVGNQHFQIVFNGDAGRAGIVFCGSGSSGLTNWTDATSPADAMLSFLADEMRS